MIAILVSEKRNLASGGSAMTVLRVSNADAFTVDLLERELSAWESSPNGTE